MVKLHTWNLGKNTKLKQERGIGFEMVMASLAKGAYKVISTPSKSHPGQAAYMVTIRGVRYVVPFTESKASIFMRTIIRYDQ
jgi:hypothetical protein